MNGIVPAGPGAANPPDVIRAAGGVAWRHDGAGGVEVCLVHRPRYGDWSLPKGKLEPGEHPLVAAVREVAEETDVQAIPQVRLPRVRYLSHGRPKVVDYWSMQAVAEGGFEPESEVDEVRWLPVEAAVDLVSYPHDAEVLRAFAALPQVTGTVALVRHAHAGVPGTWPGPDTARPLDASGLAQARTLATLVAMIRPVRLLSASPRRCVQTFDPLAELLDLPIEVDRDLDEPEPGQQPEDRVLAAAACVAAAAGTWGRVAVCSQGPVIPGALAHLTGRAGNFTTAKGGGWLLAFTAEGSLPPDRLQPQ